MENQVALAIKNFIKYGDVFVMDGGSTDNTKAISEKMGASFFLRPSSNVAQLETVVNFDFIKSKIKTDWVYWGYADNFAPKSLLEEFSVIVNQNVYKIVQIPLYTYLWGNTDNYVSKGYSPMLFHKDFMDFSDTHIHGMGRFLGTEQQCLVLPNEEKFALRHFSAYNTHKFILGHLRYAEAEAGQKFNDGTRFSSLKMLGAMMRYLWIYRRSLKKFKLGLIVMLNYAFFRFMVYASLYEQENGLNLEKIEETYLQKRNELLREFEGG